MGPGECVDGREQAGSGVAIAERVSCGQTRDLLRVHALAAARVDDRRRIAIEPQLAVEHEM